MMALAMAAMAISQRVRLSAGTRASLMLLQPSSFLEVLLYISERRIISHTLCGWII
jgi:hypothetical protein